MNRSTSKIKRQVLRLALLLVFNSAFTGAMAANRHADAQPLRLAVASNFLAPAKLIAAAFETQSGVPLTITAGATGKLYAQIRQGAPFDVFMSADVVRPQMLIDEAHATSSQVLIYAHGQLLVWLRDGFVVEGVGLEGVWGSEPTRVAMANPKLAPYGVATREVLQNAMLWDAWQSKLVLGENINQTLQYAMSGDVDIAFLARSQKGVLVVSNQIIELDGSQYGVIEQGAITLSEHKYAAAFLSFLESDEAQRIMQKFGYGKIHANAK